MEGWSEGTTLLIPRADLRHSSESIPNDVIRLPTSVTHSAVGVRLLLQEPGIATYQPIQEAFGLGVLTRPNGGAVYVFGEPLLSATSSMRASPRSEVTPLNTVTVVSSESSRLGTPSS